MYLGLMSLKLFIIAFLLSTLVTVRVYSLRCYVCGSTEDTVCESSPDVDERFLKTCNESETHCYTRKVTAYRKFGSSVSHIIRGCSVGERDNCTTVDGTFLFWYNKTCFSTCETDGCNKKVTPPNSNIATTTAFREHSTNYPPTTQTSGSLCGDMVCDLWYPYCCSSIDGYDKYCCSYYLYGLYPNIITTSQSTIEPTFSAKYGWIVAVSVVIFVTIVVIILVLICIRKVEKRRDTSRDSEYPERSGNGELPSRRIGTTFRNGIMELPQINRRQPPRYTPNAFSRTRAPLNYQRELEDALHRLDDVWISLWDESTTVERNDIQRPPVTNQLDLPPPYSAEPVLDENNVLPSYSSVMSGELGLNST